MNRNLFLSATLAVAAFSASGCADSMSVDVPDIANNYSPIELSAYGSGENQLRVEVHGDPFGAGAAATAKATVDAMQGRVHGTPVTFALDPKQERRPPSHVVVYFNPRQLVGAESYCNPSSPITEKPTGDVLRVAAAWCQGKFTLTEDTARAAGVGGLASPKFAALVGALTTEMFPLRNPNDNGDRRTCPPNCR